MNEFVGLSSHDMEHLLVTIETSLKINNRHQFFLWAQGALQGFIPHETLLCVYGDIARMRFKHESFSRGLPNTQAEQDVGNLVTGLLPRLVDDWLGGGCVPRLSNPHVMRCPVAVDSRSRPRTRTGRTPRSPTWSSCA